MSYTVLDENLMVKGRLILDNGRGSTAFFSDTITKQLATDNSNDAAALTSVDYTNQDKQGNAKQWSHSLTLSVEATDLGVSITSTDYIMYFDNVANHYYLMKVLSSATDRNSGFIVLTCINTAIYELGKQLIQADVTYSQVDLKSFVSKVYKDAPFSLRVTDDNFIVLDYTISANTSLQAVLQDLQTKYDCDVDSWVELDETGHIVDRVLFFGKIGADNGELIRYGGSGDKGLENINASEVSDIVYTKLYVTGKTDDKDPSKGHIGSVNNKLEYIVDDDANQKIYAIGASQQQPVYLEGTITNNVLSEPKALLDWANQQMAIFNHPRFNYTVTPLHDQIVGLGDNVAVQDFHIKPMILVNSKVIQKTTSFANPESNTFTLGEFSSIFTDNINKSASAITLIKKDVTVVQEAADYARAQADAAHQQAVIAQEQAIHAQTSADGKSTTFTLTSVDDLPATANDGDSAWITLSDGTYHYVYINGKWVEDLNPTLQKNIADGVNKATSDAKTYTDQAVAANDNNVSASIKAVDDKANQLKDDQTTFDNKAKGYADSARSDAEANTAAVQQQLQKAISDGDSGLQAQITSNKDEIALTATKSELNDTKTDYNAQIASVNIKADYISNTVAQVSGKVDGIQVGGRNLLFKTAFLAFAYGPNVATVTVESYDSNTNMYHIVSNGTSFAGVYFGQQTQSGNNIKNGEKWSFGIDAKGTGIPAAIGLENHEGPINQIGTISSDWSRVSFTGVASNDTSAVVIYFSPNNEPVDVYVKLPKLEKGNMPSAWSPAPEDIDAHFSTQQQTIDSINSTVVQQGTDINNVSTRVQTAEGEISTANDNIGKVDSKATQTANGLSQEVTDRQNGDSTVLQQGKDFTSQTVSSSENNMKSLINQKADSATVGVIQNDVSSLKSQVNWQQISFDDMNYLNTTGNYLVTSGKGTNSPFTPWFYITVDAPRTDRITQTAWKDSNSNLTYKRSLFGTTWSAWSQVISSATLLNIFHDSWSLGTSTNDGITKQMITGIMGQPDGTLVLKGNSLVLDGNTTVTGDFYAKGGNFQNINASNITFGEMNGNKVNITNINAKSIAAGSLTGPNLSIDLDSGNVFFQKGRIYDSQTRVDVNVDQAYVRTTNGGGSATLQNGELILTGPVYSNGQTVDSNPYFSITAGLLPTFYNQPDGAIGSLLQSKDYSEISINGHGNVGFLANLGVERSAGIGISPVTGTYVAGNNQGVILSGGKDIGGGGMAESPNVVIGYDDSKGVDGKDAGGNSILVRANKFVVASNNFTIDNNGNAKVTNSFFARNVGTNGYHTITSQDNGRLYFSGGNGNLVDISVNSVSQSSLVSLKENIVDIDKYDALNEVLKSDVKKYNFIDNNETHVSPMIDDVNHKLYIPKDWLGSDGKTVDTYTIIGYLVQSIKALNDKIEHG